MSLQAGLWLVWSVFITICLADSDVPVTKVAQGSLAGKWVTTRGGRKVAAFLTIPYAEAPIGLLRFKNPQPAKPWNDKVFNATKEGPYCIQNKQPLYGQEDCLYLNIFTPNTDPPEKYAVLVYIHGGSYHTGSSDPRIYGPEYLLDEDIILVTINYRLGIFGFLSLEHPALPGNFGLKDQREALRWIKKNIVAFGGDASRITISGTSAGSASAHLQYLFSAKEDLFRGAILDSKSAMSVSSTNLPGVQKRYVNLIAEDTRCPRDPAAFADCLRKLTADELVRLARIISRPLIPGVTRVTYLSPVIEPDSAEDIMISDDPLTLNSDLPLLISIAEREGLLPTVEIQVDKSDSLLETINAHVKVALPYYLQFDDTAPNPQNVARAVKGFYLPGKPISRENYLGLVDMVSDAHYNYGQVLAARANMNKTFFSQLNYRGSNTNVRFAGSMEYFGVTHGDSLFYLFPFLNSPIRNKTIEDTEFSKKYVKMWANFVRFQDPTPAGFPFQWTPVQTDNIEYLNIGQQSFVMQDNLLRNRIAFWDSMPYRNKYSDSCVYKQDSLGADN